MLSWPIKVELRRTRIESERYTGWTRLSLGGRKWRTAESAAEVKVGSWVRGTCLGMVGNDDGR